MNVIFNSKAKIAGKVYQKGAAILPDSFAYSHSFRSLVSSGQISIVSKSVAAQKNQAGSDALSAKLAQKAARSAKSKLSSDEIDAHSKAKASFALAQAAEGAKANRVGKKA